MRGFRFPAPEEWEKFIIYPFLGTWIACGLAVLAGALAWQGLPGGRVQAGAGLAHDAAAALVAGYFAAGVVVSLLSVVHACLGKLLGENRRATASAGFLSERRLRLAYLGFLIAAAAALGVDCPLARWCLAEKCPRLLHDLLDVCPVLGHGVGAFLIVVAIHQLDPRRRRALWWVVACVLLSGLAANGAKLLVARTRPRDFDFPGGVRATFAGWLPSTPQRQSFPSGHTATAAGLALALASLYPHGRRLFLMLVVLVACQRLECGAHYLSDVLCSAAASCLTVACCLRLARWFSRFHPPPASAA
jgi:membrane-associated phospholipid phosphatase